MGIELIKPIDSDTAHAIEEAAKTAGKAIDAASETGKYFSRVLGQVPEKLGRDSRRLALPQARPSLG